MSYVVDTNIFNKLLDGDLKFESLPNDGPLVATHVQVDELNKTKDQERRALLFLKFASLSPSLVPTESMVWGVSRWGQAKWGHGDVVQKLKSELDTLNGGKSNNWNDALIAEVAIANDFTLLTCDYHLAEAAKKHGVKVSYFAT